MAKEGLFGWVCAAAFVVAGPTALVRADPAGEREGAVAATLAVQNAMQQGRDHLTRGDARAAVFVLESQLSRINGNPTYLSLLRDAYRAYLKELRLARQEADVQIYFQRLRILDPGAVLDDNDVRSALAAAKSAEATPARSKQEPIVRGTRAEEEEPRSAPQAEKAKAARSLVAKGEEEFGKKRFKEAGQCFEQAHQSDPTSTVSCRERWAYCKLSRVVEQLNQTTGTPRWPELEKEVRHALDLAPRLDYGKYLLGEIEKRRGGNADKAGSAIPVQHLDRGTDGWARAETTNFRILHNQSRELAEQVARVAEQTRTSMQLKWFGGAGDAWNPKCEIYLYATGQDYSRATSVPATSPGHSTIRSEAGRVVGRRIDLHADEPNLQAAVLPHETTHVVIAGQFGENPVPRWADEGMAVLTEPREKVDRHLRNLSKCRQDGQLFNVRQLMQLNDYPEPRLISAFYAQSVSLVDFLSNEKGPQVFAQFLRDGLKGGYESALKKHYDFKSFDDLNQRWNQKTFAGAVTPVGVAQGKP